MNDEATAPLTGLSDREAARRLHAEGPNELPRDGRRSLARIVLDVVREPMFGLLLAAGLLYLVLGDRGEAAMLLVFACLSVGIAIVQEHRSERVLEALRDLTSPRALVVRDGRRLRIAGREVVRGDLLVLTEGDRVPADARVLEAHELSCDESLLTGESAPVRKRGADAEPAAARPGGDDLPFVYSGTLVVRGRGLACVTATGPRSEIGRIGAALGRITHEPTRLSLQTRQVVRAFGLAGVTLSALAVLLYGLLRDGWMNALLAGIALGMSMLPEEFPLVLSVFMVMGAWRISKARVLTRRAATIETLGAATVLCADKTGTLTQNRMRIAELCMNGEVFRPTPLDDGDLPETFHPLVEYAILASAPDPFDPMERAVHALGGERLAGTEHLHGEWRLEREYALDAGLLAMTQAWRAEDDETYVVAAKGAPEAIVDLCHLDANAGAAALRDAEAMARRGMRVLGVARALHRGAEWPPSQHDFDFEFVGLVGLADPLRPGAAAAVRECRAAGIRVAMITGDYPATARAIAAEAGIDATHTITGDELERMEDFELVARIRECGVFARIMPEQKLRIVEALKANGEVVAMTGDGVNDAPALKAAHIGVAMGLRGTDVAREAADLVLLDDDFGSIVRTVRLGRRIYDNLRKAMGYILAVHVPIAGLALLPLLAGTPLVLAPVHIAFLEMVIDPVCSIVFEAEREERDAMRRPPRAPDAPLFSAALIAWSLLQGALALLLVGAVYAAALRADLDASQVRALAFVALVACNVALILGNRSFDGTLATALLRPNRALWWVLGAAAALLALTLAWAPARALFHFALPPPVGLAGALAAGVVLLAALALAKPLLRARLAA
ncbi:P-type HAD superfamily ATPase [Mizugakiibacter sediminis]|uniref:P-type HAD superfamily ATPase n=1 Tax=Mizugakiibacter sediminis TaxID=1475481 RepID=A0A0K8QQF8_9GAMM|nr:cation-translocating P-type ATPase [Mizugakiibacter sediminis]GAP67123.1 P-type HAD superfamily ATPase [Mizugakiibacter sediminis]